VSAPPPWFTETLTALIERRDLDTARMGELLRHVLSGSCGEAETAALLVALRMKGETADELAAAAAVLREHAVPFRSDRDGLLDTCGTGGSGRATFNVSTATALVVAGVGVPVVKHGNWAMSGRSGSADVLAALGVTVTADAVRGRLCLERAGMAFCLAPHFHPVMKSVSGVRKRLGIRTLFNCLGPLLNPARAPYQLLGVGRTEWLDPLAGALAQLGTRHAILVRGCDGLDEVTLAAPTRVREVRGGTVRAREWTPDDFGLAPCPLEELRAEGPEESAAVVRSVLRGDDEPATRVVLANAAAALVAAERVTALREGVALAAEAIRAGRARRVLDELVAASRAES
jgi:anthranilate phosphoribosyltransferase